MKKSAAVAPSPTVITLPLVANATSVSPRLERYSNKAVLPIREVVMTKRMACATSIEISISFTKALPRLHGESSGVHQSAARTLERFDFDPTLGLFDFRVEPLHALLVQARCCTGLPFEFTKMKVEFQEC